MCLGIPGRVVSFHEDTDQLASVEVVGVPRTINIGLVKDEGLAVGDWVLMHVGFAMEIIGEDEAEQAMEGLRLLSGQAAPLDVAGPGD